MVDVFSPLQRFLMDQPLRLPSCYIDPMSVSFSMAESSTVDPTVQKTFSHFRQRGVCLAGMCEKKQGHPIRIGVVFSGGQAPGGHNVVAGIFDAIEKMNPSSILLGFEGGPSGMIEGRYREITKTLLQGYRNSGGFDLLGSGRTKIESQEQLQACHAVLSNLSLDAVVIVGGDDSNTNACTLADYLLSQGSSIAVIGVPKTIDGDLRNEYVPISFGFDTACKVYSELIGNIAVDALSSQKYYHFIKLMGRSASWVTLECALATQVNLSFIGEQVQKSNWSLKNIIENIADLISERAKIGKHYGVILIPEGLIEFIPEFTSLIQELNALEADEESLSSASLQEKLSHTSLQLFRSLPDLIQKQLLMDRDPHGNVQLSHIETEKLLSSMAADLLSKRAKAGEYHGKFLPIHHFLGYEGRSAFPSLFDAHYCYSLGYLAALMACNKLTGYMAFIADLTKDVESWRFGAVPLESLMVIEKRKGKDKPVIKKALVDVESSLFLTFQEKNERWRLEDCYRSVGPRQLIGPSSLVWQLPACIAL